MFEAVTLGQGKGPTVIYGVPYPNSPMPETTKATPSRAQRVRVVGPPETQVGNEVADMGARLRMRGRPLNITALARVARRP